MNNKLALINVIYENYTVLPDFFESLNIQSNKDYYLFNIDLSVHRSEINLNNIPGGIFFSENRGYAHGVNLGINKAITQKFKYFCVLNNDVYFKENFVQKCLDSISKHPASIIGGKIYYAAGYEYHKSSYKKTDLGKVIWYAGGRFDWKNALTPHIGVDQVDNKHFADFKPTDFVNGALMLFDNKVVEKIGYWDENYFLYFEDADYCVRAKKAGIKLYYDPEIVLWHKNSQSTGGPGSSIHQKYQNKNRLRFGLKYAPVKTKLHLIKNYFLGFIHL